MIYRIQDAGALTGEPALLRFFWDLLCLIDREKPHSKYWAKIAMTKFAALLDHSQVGNRHLHQLAYAVRNVLYEDFEDLLHPFEEMEEAAERSLYEKLCDRLNKYCDEKITTDYRTMKPLDRSTLEFNMQQMLRLIDPEDKTTLIFAEDFLHSFSQAIGPWENYSAQLLIRETRDFAALAEHYCENREDYLEIPENPVESRERRRRMSEDAAPMC